MEADTTFDFDAVEPASSEAVLKAQLSNSTLPVIGGVAIPSVAINLPILRGYRMKLCYMEQELLAQHKNGRRKLCTS